MRRKTRDTGRLKLIAFFIFVAVLLPKFLNARSTDNLGSFEAGETGIKLCARINNGNEDALRFLVTNDQGFTSDVVVAKDTCKTIEASAATFTIREYLPQEYVLDSVSGGTVSADATSFLATSAGQYTIIYENTFSGKPYLHNFGYTGSLATATAVGIIFDANGGTGTMNEQFFGLQAQQNLTANTFTREGYNFTGWNTKADGTGTAYEDGHAFTFSEGGEYTLYAQWEEVPADPSIADDIADQANDPVEIDFTRKAVVSATPATANGNGINRYTENGQDVYYYRGEIADNNVIWADKCWKIIRTTSTGGVKLIYNGERTKEENMDGDLIPVNRCEATGINTAINSTIDYTFNGATIMSSGDISIASVGYMYGDNVQPINFSFGITNEYVFANNVELTNGVYVLSGDKVTGTYTSQASNISAGHRYFCSDGTATCDGQKIRYIVEGSKTYPIGGYEDFEDLKAHAFTNTNDSNAKNVIESWFESENLDSHEDDLEDVVYCNDRTLVSGAYYSKDIQLTRDPSFFAAHNRVSTLNAQNNYSPSLNCSSKNDSFTKAESTTGNGMLGHKVGLITADELTLAGIVTNEEADGNYLSSGTSSEVSFWTMTPYSGHYEMYVWSNVINGRKHYASYNNGLRPVVSLKSTMKFADGGAGTSTNPYIVEE